MPLSELTNFTELLETGSDLGPAEQIVQIPIEDIMPDPEQVRPKDSVGFSDDSIEQLATAIKENGLISPIRVRPPNDDGKYIIITGERRFTAVCRLGWPSIPCLVDTQAADQSAADLLVKQLVENEARENLSLPEISAALVRLVDSGLTPVQIAERTGFKLNQITMYRRFAEMPPYLKDLYAQGKLASSARTCYDLANLYDKDPEKCEAWVEETLREREQIGRSDVDQLRKFLNAKSEVPPTDYSTVLEQAHEQDAGTKDDAEEDNGPETEENAFETAYAGGSPAEETDQSELQSQDESTLSASYDDQRSYENAESAQGEPWYDAPHEMTADDHGGAESRVTASFEEQDAALEDKDPWSADEEDQTEAEESAAESEAIESSASAAEMVPGFWVRWQGQEVRLTFERAADPLYGVVITGQDSRAEVPLSEICLLRQM